MGGPRFAALDQGRPAGAGGAAPVDPPEVVPGAPLPDAEHLAALAGDDRVVGAVDVRPRDGQLRQVVQPRVDGDVVGDVDRTGAREGAQTGTRDEVDERPVGDRPAGAEAGHREGHPVTR